MRREPFLAEVEAGLPLTAVLRETELWGAEEEEEQVEEIAAGMAAMAS